MIYSTFFSYRRNSGNKDYIYNLRDILQTEGLNATNLNQIFFDENCIELGNEFDGKIYSGIVNSFSFSIIFSPHYINEKNDWCARELYRAILFEKYLRKKINNNNLCFIFPFIYRGTTADLPKSINNKNAKSIFNLELDISTRVTSKNIVDFKQEICKVFLDNFKLIENLEITAEEIEENIKIPSDDELHEWIKEMKGLFRENERKHLPKLT